MKILLDTQAWLWMVHSPERFRANARRQVMAQRNERILSAVSAWEIAIKYAIGKLSLPERPSEFVPRLLAVTRTYPMAVQHSHALRVAELPVHHVDPFDRLIIAQAQIEEMPILTADRQFEDYDVKIIWAN
jgi:PIN domain nuclease of toxin-antitoxin system